MPKTTTRRSGSVTEILTSKDGIVHSLGPTVTNSKGKKTSSTRRGSAKGEQAARVQVGDKGIKKIKKETSEFAKKRQADKKSDLKVTTAKGSDKSSADSAKIKKHRKAKAAAKKKQAKISKQEVRSAARSKRSAAKRSAAKTTDKKKAK